jgi:hypothetical protein
MVDETLNIYVDREKASPEFFELLERCYQEHPDDDELAELRAWLDKTPELWSSVFDLARSVRDNLVKNIIPHKAAHIGLYRNITKMRGDMGFKEASTLEKLLIENVINTWLRYQWAEFRYTSYVTDAHTLNQGKYWSGVLSANQRRYLRAIETLARVRKLTRNTPMLQVNIATQEGQQVNIAGDFVKEEKAGEKD